MSKTDLTIPEYQKNSLERGGYFVSNQKAIQRVTLFDLNGDAITVDENAIHVHIPGKVDSGNSTEDLLLADQEFNGEAFDITEFATFFITVRSDVASATDGLQIWSSTNGTDFYLDDVYTIPSNTLKKFSFQCAPQWYKIKYINGGSDQTSFHLQAICKRTDAKHSSHRIQDSIVDDDDATLHKSVITGRNPAGVFVNFGATTSGNFKVSLEEFENQVSVNNNTQLRSTIYSESGVPIFSEATSDAFGRWRTSSTGQRLDVEFIYDKQQDFFDEITNNGTVTFNGNSRDLTLSISDANNGTYAQMISHPVPYTPGNSQLIDITGVLDLAGIGGGNAELFLRSTISGTTTDLNVIDQSSWDNLTTGVDWTASHILMIDFQSLKVGRIRFHLVQDGSPVKLTEINNDNLRNTGYWQLPSLSAYYKLYNDATYTYMEMGYGNDENAIGIRYKITANASATMRAICCTIKSEGGNDLADIKGIPSSCDRAVTPITVGTTLIPILSVRSKDAFLTYDNLSIALPKSYSVSIDNPILLRIIYNGTLTGASFTDIDSNNSALEYDTAATAITGGQVVHSEYIGTSKNTTASEQGFLGKTVLWNRKSSLTGIFTLCAVRTTSTNASVLASLDLEEIR